MKVKKLHLENYGRFDNLTVEFAPTATRTGNVTLIVGNNGAGKSQILLGLRNIFREFLAELHEDREREHKYIDEAQRKKGSDFSSIEINISSKKFANNKKEKHENIDIELGLRNEYNISGRVGRQTLHYNNINKLLLDRLKESPLFSLPIVACYFTERLNTPPIFHKQNRLSEFKQFEGYVNTLAPEIDFEAFVLWFKNREDIDNAELRKGFEAIIQHHKRLNSDNKELTSEILDLVSGNNRIMQGEIQDKQLLACKNAILSFLSDFSDLWINRESQPFQMEIQKGDDTLSINQLSQGEKSMLALIGDIARRLAILNPGLENPLEGDGVVMIDEVDLHLHPKWQHDLIDKLVGIFPNCQFILTTHSPHIISDREDVLVYALEDGELTRLPNIYGDDVNSLLSQVFDVDVRDSKVEKEFNTIRRAISENHLDQAEQAIEELAKKLSPHNVELLKCRLMLAQAKLTEQDS